MLITALASPLPRTSASWPVSVLGQHESERMVWPLGRSNREEEVSTAPVDTETWGDRDSKVEVTQPEGFMMKVRQ